MPLQTGHGKWLAFLGSDYSAAANTLNANLGPANLTRKDNLQVLQVRFKFTATNAGHFLADAAQVFGLAAMGIMIAQNRFLAAYGTLTSHQTDLQAISSFRAKPELNNIPVALALASGDPGIRSALRGPRDPKRFENRDGNQVTRSKRRS